MPSRSEAIFAQPAQFLTSSPDLAHLPETDMPEVAFAGRSNCGKSSLLNALMGGKNLARTSNTPGRTKLLNFFSIGQALMLVDLPGYGFARATCAERAQWQQNWQAYIQKRTALRHVFVLIDARRGLMPIDRKIMSGLDNAATSYSIVLTKADKIPTRIVEQTQTLIAETLTRHPAAWLFPLVCSAKKLQGIQELRQGILISIR